MYNSNDTITAIATPLGLGAIGIIRISGKDTLDVVGKIFHSSQIGELEMAVPNHMYVGTIETDRITEQCMLAFFKAPLSYTGENMIELFCHGGVRMLECILQSLIEKGARLATGGEFTRRAFLNGKMALADAEGIIDIINAESESAINSAYRLLSGKLSLEIGKLRDKLLEAISGLEVSLDYPDEMEEDTRAIAIVIIPEIIDRLKMLLDSSDIGQVIKHGINVAIVGAPNVGKSSLVNAILGSDRVIVSDIAGTTRDTVSESIVAFGYKINFVDTAGIRNDSKDTVEQMGIERSLKAIEGADIIINVIDSVTSETISYEFDSKKIITVYNKSDLKPAPLKERGISALKGKGIKELVKAIVDKATYGQIKMSGEVLTNTRHIEAIRNAYELLSRAKDEFQIAPTDCIVIDMRAAYNSLGEIDGLTASEKIIDDIFSRFCVGK